MYKIEQLGMNYNLFVIIYNDFKVFIPLRYNLLQIKL
jgi:hypothetical protein